MARRLTEVYTREAFLAPFKFPRTKTFTGPYIREAQLKNGLNERNHLKPMAGAGEDSMMDWDFSFIYPYINPEGQLIELPDSPSTNTFVTQSEPCDPFNPIAKTEVQVIAGGSSGAQSAEVSTSNVESCAAQTKRRAAAHSIDNSRAKDSTDSKGKEKRGRASNWSNDEKEAFLILKLEALEKSEKSWFRFVSDKLRRRHEIERTDTACQQQWDLLNKAYKAIRNLHDLKSRSEEHPVLFWDMDESARMAMKKMWNEDLKYLPGAFPKEWYDLMEKIIVLQAQVKKTQDINFTHVGEINREPSTSTRVNVWPGALECSTIPPNQALVSKSVLCHDCIKQQSIDNILPDEEMMSRIVLLVDKQIEQALMPELLRREEDNEQRYRENLHAREGEHKRKLQAFEVEHSQRLLAMEAEHSQRLQAIEAEHSQRFLAMEAEHSQRLQAIEAEHSQRFLAMEAELLRRMEEVEQKHRKCLLDMLDEEELAASLKLTTIKERKRELA